MSLADNKKSVFTKIKAYNSIAATGKMPKQTNSYSSINNSKEVIPFLLDTLKCVAGTEALKILLGKMLTNMLKNVEPNLKTGIKKQFTQSNSDDELSNDFVTNGVSMSVKTIDTAGKLKISPTSTETGGNLIYASPNDNNFDYKAHDAIRLEGTNINCNNMSIKYDSVNDGFNIKPNINNNNLKVGTYFNNYIDKTQIINTQEIVSKTMDKIFGTLSKDQDKTEDEIYDELQIEKMLEQVINGDDSFEISPDVLGQLRQQATEIANGATSYDLGCGIMPVTLSIDTLNNIMTSISGSTNAFAVGNAIESALNDSIDDTDENKQTIKDNFLQKFINILVIKILHAVTTAPQIRVLMAIMGSLQNQGDILLSDAKADMKKWKIYIKCMAKDILKMVAEFIFNLAIGYLIKLLTPIIKKVGKEQITQFSNIIKSFSGRFGKLAEKTATG